MIVVEKWHNKWHDANGVNVAVSTLDARLYIYSPSFFTALH